MKSIFNVKIALLLLTLLIGSIFIYFAFGIWFMRSSAIKTIPTCFIHEFNIDKSELPNLVEKLDKLMMRKKFSVKYDSLNEGIYSKEKGWDLNSMAVNLYVSTQSPQSFTYVSVDVCEYKNGSEWQSIAIDLEALIPKTIQNISTHIQLNREIYKDKIY